MRVHWKVTSRAFNYSTSWCNAGMVVQRRRWRWLAVAIWLGGRSVSSAGGPDPRTSAAAPDPGTSAAAPDRSGPSAVAPDRSAAAQPAAAGVPARDASTTPLAAECNLRIRRVPAAQRAVLHHALATLDVCKAQLDVFVVETPGGFYVVVRDRFGRVTDRVVPTMEVAATVIASLSGQLDEPLAGKPAIDDEAIQIERVAENDVWAQRYRQRWHELSYAFSARGDLAAQAVEWRALLRQHGRMQASVGLRYARWRAESTVYIAAPTLRVLTHTDDVLVPVGAAWSYRLHRRLWLEPGLQVAVGASRQREARSTGVPYFTHQWQLGFTSHVEVTSVWLVDPNWAVLVRGQLGSAGWTGDASFAASYGIALGLRYGGV